MYQKLYEIFEKDYLMYAMAGVLITSSLGAAGAMLALYQGHTFLEMFQVAVLVAGCMMFDASILANRGPKTVFRLFWISIILSLIIITIHLF